MMNPALVSSVQNAMPGNSAMTISSSQISSGMISDDLSEPSSPESSFDTSELLGPNGINDDVTVQLASADETVKTEVPCHSPVGMAAAAAIASGKKRKRAHSFETNPSIRRRQQTRLLRKLKNCIDEYTTRVGQQAVILCCTPGKGHNANSYKVFGSQPLENVIRNCKGVVLQDLETTLSEQIPQTQELLNGTHELPPLSIDGIPTSVDKMTQAQLRTFIPEMLKFSTGRSKPGWGKMDCRPQWWPDDVPWANVRSDVRSSEQKKRVSWTDALRTIVKNCYKHHGREDLLHVFQSAEQTQARTVLQTINNPDGTVSIIQIDTSPTQVVTLPDGTQAQVVHTVQHEAPQQEDNQAVQTLANVASHQQEVTGLPVSVEMNTDTVRHSIATINEEGHIVLTGDDLGGTSGIVIPVSVYQPLAQATVTSYGTLQSQGSLQVAMAPAVVTKEEYIDDSREQVNLQEQSPGDMTLHTGDRKLEES